MKRVLVVSPHRDDAAFSCGIAIRTLVGQCDVTVSNLFTVSQYAPFSDAPPQGVSALRLGEDLSYSHLAGVALDDLDLVDAPERLAIEMSDISTVRPLDDRDQLPFTEIRNHIVEFRPDLVLVPLALGDHIDHRIAQSAALAAGTDALAFYEDLPYAARLTHIALETRVSSLNLNLAPLTFRADDGAKWKETCAGCYPSQIAKDTVTEIACFSHRYGNGERFWVTPSASRLLNELALSS